MTTTPGSKPAFPHSPVVGVGVSGGGYAGQSHGVPMYGHEPGLTKREYFAAMAMQGMLANGQPHTRVEWHLTSQAVKYADLLTEQLERTE